METATVWSFLREFSLLFGTGGACAGGGETAEELLVWKAMSSSEVSPSTKAVKDDPWRISISLPCINRANGAPTPRVRDAAANMHPVIFKPCPPPRTCWGARNGIL